MCVCMRVSTRLYLPTTTTEYVCVCVYVCMASRIYSVCIYSVRVYLLCMRVSTPSTQNPDERARSDRARSDRAHATTIQGQLRFDHNLQGACIYSIYSKP